MSKIAFFLDASRKCVPAADISNPGEAFAHAGASEHGHVLTPGRYVGTAAAEEDGEPFEEKIKRLTAQLREQMAEGRKLDAAIETNLKELGYGE